MTSKWTNPETGTTWELWEGKLPKGWRRRIPGHNVGSGSTPNIQSCTYVSWFSMVKRCYTEYQRTYPGNRKYQAEGVQVCTRWVTSFLHFLEDMGERPEGTTLDRIDPTGHYTPDNCRWADIKTQAGNKRKKRAA